MIALAALLALVTVLLITRRSTRGIHRLRAVASASPSSPASRATVQPGARLHLSEQRRLAGIGERRRLLAFGAADFARSSRRRLGVLTGLVAVGILTAVTDPSTLVLVLTLTSVAAVIARQRAAARRTRAATARRTAVIEACDVLAAELSAGRPPSEGLEAAATVCPDLQIASAAAKLGGDVPAALDLAAESPGSEGLRALAAAWRVAEESGAAFAAITERLAESLRADESIRRQITSTLAGPRATARLLAILPLFGSFIGFAIGANPLTFLLHTPPGWLCLALGLFLTFAGLQWTNSQAKPPWEKQHA